MDEPEEPLERIQQRRRDDPAAFDRIVRDHARSVYARLFLAVRDRDRADDLTQETFLRAWRSFDQLRDPALLRTWLAQIARSVLLDDQKHAARQKRRGTMTPDSSVETLPGEQPPPHESLERCEQRERLLSALEALPDSYRDVLALRYLAGADYSTIATQLQLSDGALRGLLNRGLKMIREKLSRCEVPL